MAGHRLGALEGGGGVPPPSSNASLGVTLLPPWLHGPWDGVTALGYSPTPSSSPPPRSSTPAQTSEAAGGCVRLGEGGGGRVALPPFPPLTLGGRAGGGGVCEDSRRRAPVGGPQGPRTHSCCFVVCGALQFGASHVWPPRGRGQRGGGAWTGSAPCSPPPLPWGLGDPAIRSRHDHARHALAHRHL